MASRFAQHMCVTREEATTAEAPVADVLLKVGKGGREGGRERRREGGKEGKEGWRRN
jgi:hypothetical protein